MQPHAPSSEDGHDDSHGSTGKYLTVFVALCILTSASIFTTSSFWPFPDQPAVGWAFMMAVSCAKAMLVILFFMHLIWEANWKYVLTIPAACMSLFLVLMLVPDIGLRTDHYSDERWWSAAYPGRAEATSHGGHGESSEHADDHDHEDAPEH